MARKEISKVRQMCAKILERVSIKNTEIADTPGYPIHCDIFRSILHRTTSSNKIRRRLAVRNNWIINNVIGRIWYEIDGIETEVRYILLRLLIIRILIRYNSIYLDI